MSHMNSDGEKEPPKEPSAPQLQPEVPDQMWEPTRLLRRNGNGVIDPQSGFVRPPPAVPPQQHGGRQPEPWWPQPQMMRNPLLYINSQASDLPPPQGPAVGRAAGEGSADAGGASTATATGLSAPGEIGKLAIVNRDVVLAKTLSIELLLRALVDREKEARPNAGSLPELETILADVVDIRATLLTTVAAPSDANVGTRALSFKSALVNLWNKEHVSILKLGFDATLFFLGLELIAYFGLVNATIMATVIRQKEIPEALKHLSEIMKSISGGSR